MHKVLIAAIGLAVAGALADIALAKSACEEWRDRCYAEASPNKDAMRTCELEFDRCTGSALLQRGNPVVPTVAGLGMPMQQRNPSVPLSINPTTATPNATITAYARVAKDRKKTTSATAAGASVSQSQFTSALAGGSTKTTGNSSSSSSPSSNPKQK